jgi:spore maturation protein SpmA
MVLNYIWIAFILLSFLVGMSQLLFLGNVEIMGKMVESTFSMSKTAFNISIGLTGVLTLWLGLMRVGEKGGAVNILAKLVRPFFFKVISRHTKRPSCIW